MYTDTNNKKITEHNLELGYPCYVTDTLWGVRDNQRIQLYNSVHR